MIKIIVLLISLIAFENYGYSQVYINGKNINDSVAVKVIELDAVDNLISSGGWDKQRWYRVNYGQSSEHENSQITDFSGKRLPLKNVIEIANYIANRGWFLLQVNYYVLAQDNIPSYKYTFVRK